MKKYPYYYVNLFTGEYEKRYAKSEFDLEIKLENGDCVATEKKAQAMEYKIKTGAEEL